MRKLTLEHAQRLAAKRGGKCLVKEYKNNSTKMPWKCHIPEHKMFYNTYANIGQGQWCPECSFSRSQKHLVFVFKEMFYKYKILLNFKGFGWLLNENKTHPLEIDIFVEDFKLAVEYDGEQHFNPIVAWGGKKRLEIIQARDRLKDKLISQHPSDVKYFIRFNYKEFDYRTPVSKIKTIVIDRLKQCNVPLPENI